MRSVLIALLGFIAGVALTLFIGVGGLQHPASTPADSTAAARAASLQDADPADAPADNWPDNAPSPEQVLYAQPRMVQEAITRLGPRTQGKPNLYLLAFAGDGSQDVFRNEAEYAARAFTQRYGAATTHALVLENNPASVTTHPLATWSNLEAALDGLAQTMDPAQDILLLYVTSHGGEDHNLLIDLDPLPLDTIGATELADILRTRPFKWKVVVVNACYSGGFVPPLRGPGTLVLTAARADRSSFGCGSDADVTYFGRAWLVDALNRTPDIIDAFQQARAEIGQWERRDKLTPSEPQIDIGSGVAAQLALWRKGTTPGPPLPFTPAAAIPASPPVPR
ncbi:MAG: C13 family peptidase [Rhodanobacter sp.]